MHFEALEYQCLAPFAIKSRESLGRTVDEPLSISRTCFQRDRDRIIHSKAFRRLKHKTQVLIASYSDHSRSRLTHTIEVAQISRHLARLLQVNEDLTECIALAHDLGHPPFGHSGERKLNFLMKHHGGFEHNIQSLRIIEHIEKKYPHFDGLNLSFEVKEGLKKHTLNTLTTVEAQIANIADEIAYNNHDIDDGLRIKLLKESDLDQKVTLWQEAKKIIQKKYVNLDPSQRCHLINSYLISAQIINVSDNSQKNLKTHSLSSVQALQKHRYPIVSFCPEMNEKNRELRHFLATHFYHHEHVSEMNITGKNIIQTLFKTFKDTPKLLPKKYIEKIKHLQLERVICDYIAGMTDVFAKEQYERLVTSKELKV